MSPDGYFPFLRRVFKQFWYFFWWWRDNWDNWTVIFCTPRKGEWLVGSLFIWILLFENYYCCKNTIIQYYYYLIPFLLYHLSEVAKKSIVFCPNCHALCLCTQSPLRASAPLVHMVVINKVQRPWRSLHLIYFSFDSIALK